MISYNDAKWQTRLCVKKMAHSKIIFLRKIENQVAKVILSKELKDYEIPFQIIHANSSQKNSDPHTPNMKQQNREPQTPLIRQKTTITNVQRKLRINKLKTSTNQIQ